ncbi:hypothetical protein HanPI659440_Chr04g0175901 [Helianthus annuus]|nr:hypothetical protein HanPI659440_Chr04g0175901 [Helianthus annuus]
MGSVTFNLSESGRRGKSNGVLWIYVRNMFDEHVYEIERLILIVLWIYNMKHWRFEEVWGLRS